jgi:predicted permease
LNVFRGDGLSREIDEEMESHIQEAVEQGRDPAEARKAFGSALRQRDASRDLKLIPWLDSLRADAVFGWRQLWKRKVTSAAAILSLGLAIGACTSAFRFIDALLLRPLPVASPERLYQLAREERSWDGTLHYWDSWAYPAFRLMRAAAKDQAELIALSASRHDVLYAAEQETERPHVQFASGWMFHTFGLRPALGRLLTEDDDRELGAHPNAVLSYDYWNRRFARDPKVIGRTFRMDKRLYEIVGVADAPFTGTDTGFVIDIFVPATMHPNAARSDSTWHETLVQLKPGVSPEPVAEKLSAISHAFEAERAKGFTGMSKQAIEKYLDQRAVLEPASAGASGLQKAYRRPLMVLAVLVALVLLIACANVANLMTAQAAARAREMALRVSIGAGRGRLVQLVLVESAILAIVAAALGAIFAQASAPFVIGWISEPGEPVRLPLPIDWRILGFGLALTLVVTCLFGMGPALSASSVKPASALKGGEDPHSRRRLMQALIGVQVAFCFLVLFVAGMFVATFERLSNLPTGFSAERIVTLETVSERPQPAPVWDQLAEHLRTVPGVETAALASRPLLSGYSNNNAVAIDGGPPSEDMAYFLNVSPGFLDAMKIPFLGGRDFRPEDAYPGSAIVSETFAKRFFPGKNPVGRTFEEASDDGSRLRLRIVGLVRDARYLDMRRPMLSVAYIPFRREFPLSQGTLILRTAAADPLALASILRAEVSRTNPEFRVRNVETQVQINQMYTFRERLLAMLAAFFAGVALLLAAVGLYGVLDYSVLQRRREIGIRIAIGARAAGIARLVTIETFSMVLIGGVAGIALGMGSMRFIESLLYDVKATDPAVLAIPSLIILLVGLLAAIPAVVRAVRIDPVAMLRSE